MCTALHLAAADRYFGRNLDLDRSYGEEVCVLPRHFPLAFSRMGETRDHYAIYGMAKVVNGYPLFYDAANEYGLGMAGLNFPGNAYYPPETEKKDNVAPYEFIPYLLSQCRTVKEAREALQTLSLSDISFLGKIPPAPLHFMLSDGKEAITVEPMRDGLHIYENPIGVLSNNPPFPHHLEALEKYRHLRTDNRDVEKEEGDLPYSAYCQGLGAVGLPGDLSSQSRLIRAVFGRENVLLPKTEGETVGQFFHLLTSVEMIKGLCKTDAGEWDYTVYSACMNLSKGIYYYTTYENRGISAVHLDAVDRNGKELSLFPLHTVCPNRDTLEKTFESQQGENHERNHKNLDFPKKRAELS